MLYKRFKEKDIIESVKKDLLINELKKPSKKSATTDFKKSIDSCLLNTNLCQYYEKILQTSNTEKESNPQKEKRERYKTYTNGSLNDNFTNISKRASMKKFSKDFQSNATKTKRETFSQKKLNNKDNTDRITANTVRAYINNMTEMHPAKNHTINNTAKHSTNNSYNCSQKNKTRTSKTPRVYTNQFSKILTHISYHSKKDSSNANMYNSTAKKAITPKDAFKNSKD